ncbi:MAG: MaoC family dehydratase [Burkholderiales bacterium]|nr:MaoC family dehydratase [Burkholderiales bacterium]
MTVENERPIYEWAVAQVGDTIAPARVRVDPARIALYVKTSGDDNPIYTDEAFARSKGLDGCAVPIAMAMRVAPTRRSVIMANKGYRHPVRPTPFARWQVEFAAPMKPGDVVTSESKLGEKFDKRGRKYLVWHVKGSNQDGAPVLEYRSTNAWEGTRPEDTER